MNLSPIIESSRCAGTTPRAFHGEPKFVACGTKSCPFSTSRPNAAGCQGRLDQGFGTRHSPVSARRKGPLQRFIGVQFGPQIRVSSPCPIGWREPACDAGAVAIACLGDRFAIMTMLLAGVLVCVAIGIGVLAGAGTVLTGLVRLSCLAALRSRQAWSSAEPRPPPYSAILR